MTRPTSELASTADPGAGQLVICVGGAPGIGKDAMLEFLPEMLEMSGMNPFILGIDDIWPPSARLQKAQELGLHVESPEFRGKYNRDAQVRLQREVAEASQSFFPAIAVAPFDNLAYPEHDPVWAKVKEGMTVQGVHLVKGLLLVLVPRTWVERVNNGDFLTEDILSDPAMQGPVAEMARRIQQRAESVPERRVTDLDKMSGAYYLERLRGCLVAQRRFSEDIGLVGITPEQQPSAVAAEVCERIKALCGLAKS